MRSIHHACIGLTLALALAAPGLATALSASDRSVVLEQVRGFMLQVAHDVSTNGPTAWRAQFADTPAFFMAVNGRMQFADGAAARAGIAALPKVIQHITLKWGDDLRIDPLTADYAVVATSYTEILVSPQGERHRDAGFFTAVAERDRGRWRLRDAHWSSAPGPP
jgi:hypothetical protein